MLEKFIIFSGGLAVLIALGQFVRRYAPRNLLLGGLFALLGIVQITAGLGYELTQPYESFLLRWRFPAIFLLGPLLLFYIQSLTVDEYRLRKSHLLHLVPALLVLPVLFAGEIGAASGVKSKWFPLPAIDDSSEPRTVHALAVLTLIVYLIFISRKLSFLSFNGGNEEKQRRIYYGFIVAGLLVALGAAVIIFLNFTSLLRIVNVLAALLIVLSYLAGQRYPYLENRLELELKTRYRNSLLRRLNLPDLEKRIDALMTGERVYLDEDLTLPALAAQLDITVHQLSQYLNEQKRVNFNRFLNEYRIAEACELLLSEPDRSALSIGLAVGFNSNSAFYSAFKSITGMTPSAYRKRG